MKKSIAIKLVFLFIAVVATFTLLYFQRNDVEIQQLFSQEAPRSHESNLGIENIMPEPMLTDIKRKIQEEEEQEKQVENNATSSQEERGDRKYDTELTQLDEGALPTYIEIIDACGPYYGGDCLNVRAEPSTSSEIQTKLRNGQVLKVEDVVQGDGILWYKIVFDEWIRHPERLNGDWYVAAEFVKPVLKNTLDKPSQSTSTQPKKRIVVDLSEQMLYAYDGDEIYMQEPVSTGVIGALTPRGTFTVFYRTPSRYMQGPIPGITDDDYDLPGVPWNLYFTEQGAVIHGAYWHDNFGTNWSHGCVNLPPEKAQKLFAWTPVGTEVTVQD
jgi:uncharacterized protein YgiM (DUF1202 family)